MPGRLTGWPARNRFTMLVTARLSSSAVCGSRTGSRRDFGRARAGLFITLQIGSQKAAPANHQFRERAWNSHILNGLQPGNNSRNRVTPHERPLRVHGIRDGKEREAGEAGTTAGRKGPVAIRLGEPECHYDRRRDRRKPLS